MTRAEVTRIAHESGYGNADQSWLTRSVARQSKQSKELSFLDLRFRSGRLAGFTVRTYDARTKRVLFRDVDLCGGTVSTRR